MRMPKPFNPPSGNDAHKGRAPANICWITLTADSEPHYIIATVLKLWRHPQLRMTPPSVGHSPFGHDHGLCFVS